MVTLIVLAKLCTESVNGFRYSRVLRPTLVRQADNGRTSRGLRWLSALSDDVDIGSQLLGEVYEHDTNLKDPRILFNVKGRNGENLRGSLSTRNLSWQERMALQVGAMMQVYVIEKENDNQ